MTVPSLIGDADLERLVALASGAPPGAIAEIGVYGGGSALRLYDVALAQDRVLYLYDTFAGHPAVDPARDQHDVGRYTPPLDTERVLAERMPRAIIVRGVFPDSLIPMHPLAFVHADVDLYAPTLAVCTMLPSLMVPGGRLYFDDYGVPDCPGCTAAVDLVFGDRVQVQPNGKALVIV